MKKWMSMAVCISILFLLSGCALVEYKKEPKNQIHTLEVWSAAENDEWIYHVNYPHFYYGFNNVDMGETTHYDMEQAIPVEEVSGETFAYLRDYILGLEDETAGEDSVFAYRIILYYYDVSGEYQRVYVDGYDDFPEGFDLFVDQVNEICGAPYLTGGGKLQEVTPEFLTQIWGVTDDDVPGGTLEELIAQEEMDMKSLTEAFSLRMKLDAFYAQQKAPVIDPYRATEIRETGSTQDEYDAFVAAFRQRLAEIGYDLNESADKVQDQDHMVRYNNEFYIARSADLKHMSLDEPTGEGDCYRIELDAHMEGMTMSVDFIYSRDGKFILIDCNDVDVQEAFVR